MGLSPIEPDRAGENDPGEGRRLALDVGTVRIGVASSDRDGRLAMPVETVRRSHKRVGDEIPDGEDIRRLLEIVEEYEPVEIVIGLPRDLKGNGSASIVHARDIGRRLERRLAARELTIPVKFADERLTTVIATQALHASGLTERAGRRVVDQAAAVEILQTWLDARRTYLAQKSGEEYPDGEEPRQ
ncbi:Holliday junction resolvase RuvX [Corynebacterium pyruviciproducens]